MIVHLPPAHTFSYGKAKLVVYIANKGEGLTQHVHEENHANICAAGSCLIRVEGGKELTMTKETQPVDLPANLWHEIEAIEDNTVFINVFAEA